MPDLSGDDITNRVRPSLWRRLSLAVSLLLLSLLAPLAASAATLAEARKLYDTGDYSGCIEACKLGTEANRWFEEWWILKIKAELTTGAYAEALKSFEAAHQIHTFSLPLKWTGVEVLRRTGRADEATALMKSITALAEAAPRRLEEVSSRVAAGRAMLASGADARVVLENYYDRAKKDDPSSPEPYLAAGELSLSKYDFALAAEAFAGAVKRAPESPDAHMGLALAYQESDAERANRIAEANLGVGRAPSHGQDLTGGGIFQIKRLGYDYAEYLFYGWNVDIRRNATQLVTVRKGAHADIRKAVVRSMIDIIRRHEQGDFLWESRRLGRNVNLSARAADDAGLEGFLMKEFFDDPGRSPVSRAP